MKIGVLPVHHARYDDLLKIVHDLVERMAICRYARRYPGINVTRAYVGLYRKVAYLVEIGFNPVERRCDVVFEVIPL